LDSDSRPTEKLVLPYCSTDEVPALRACHQILPPLPPTLSFFSWLALLGPPTTTLAWGNLAVGRRREHRKGEKTGPVHYSPLCPPFALHDITTDSTRQLPVGRMKPSCGPPRKLATHGKTPQTHPIFSTMFKETSRIGQNHLWAPEEAQREKKDLLLQKSKNGRSPNNWATENFVPHRNPKAAIRSDAAIRSSLGKGSFDAPRDLWTAPR